MLLVHEEAEPDPEHPDVFLLGACEPACAALEDALAAAGDLRPAEKQSVLHLWYGSFVAMAERARAFNWACELEETILHELTHHWEQRAGLDGLDRFDAAQVENFRRLRGCRVLPGFWRDGEAWHDGRWHIDGDVFVEVDGPPPWTVLDGLGQQVQAVPDECSGIATLPGHGAMFDGERGDLVVAPRPRPRAGLLRRFANWLRRPAGG